MAKYNAQVGETVYTFTSTNYDIVVDAFVIVKTYKSSPSIKRDNKAHARHAANGLVFTLSLVDCFSEAEMLEKKKALEL